MGGTMFLCDKDLARILGVSQATITRATHGAFSKTKGNKPNVLAKITPIFVGGARRWNIVNVADALGVDVSEITKTLEG